VEATPFEQDQGNLGKSEYRSEWQSEAPPEHAGEGQQGQRQHGAAAVATPQQPPGGALSDAYEEERGQEPDGGVNSMAPHRALALCIEHGTDIFERAAPLWAAIWAASATDPYVEQYWERVATARRAGMSQLAARLDDLGALRDDITPARATDVLLVLISHETFRALVQQAAWTLPAYKAWLFAALVHQLIRPGKVPRSSTSGLSFDSALHEA
jgi:hypothetical protein